MKLGPGWLKKQLNAAAERAAEMPQWMTRGETVLEQSEKLDGTLVQTVRLTDGAEVQREISYTCSICGAVDNERPFPTSAISCMRRGCRL